MGHLLLTAAACFFVWFGVALLLASYGLKDPFSFIMTFFAASLIILISLVMVLGFLLRMRQGLQPKPQAPDAEPGDLQPPGQHETGEHRHQSQNQTDPDVG